MACLELYFGTWSHHGVASPWVSVRASNSTGGTISQLEGIDEAKSAVKARGEINIENKNLKQRRRCQGHFTQRNLHKILGHFTTKSSTPNKDKHSTNVTDFKQIKTVANRTYTFKLR